MNYRIGTNVYVSGHKIGMIKHLVVDPYSQQVTHIVIQNLETDNLKIAPLELIEIQTKNAIILSPKVQWMSLLDYHPHYYEEVNDNPVTVKPMSYLHPLYYSSHSFSHPQTQKKEVKDGVSSNAALQKGAEVYDKYNAPCGTVISRGEDSEGHLTHLVILLLNGQPHEVDVPLRWIAYTLTKGVHLNIQRSVLMA